ncbi:hypothetical protein KIW84_050107 [Lathyrus oleraceus]|uniref:Uncharacterized protein n=1 Tax=Pisum sativum TaxID=3888 RepID=A0A9D4WJ15_PEA|nr:hypothetical protein KIW84_050107 [Pisum sativum]
MTSSETSQSSLSKNENSSCNIEKSVFGNSLKNAFKTFARQITIKLDDSNFLSWKQQVKDILESIGDPISHRDQLKMIMDGLPTEYQGLASIIQYRDELCIVIVVETMILSHEASLERAPQTPVQKPLFINLTQDTTATTLYYTLTNKLYAPQDA